jgi:hypothetical protein
MEPQIPIDVQRILDRKRKRAEYEEQLKLKRKTDWESLTAIDAEYVLEKKHKNAEYARQYRLRQKLEYNRHAQHCNVWHVYVLCETYPWSDASTIRQKLSLLLNKLKYQVSRLNWRASIMMWRKRNNNLTHIIAGSVSDRLQNDKEWMRRTAYLVLESSEDASLWV